MLMEGEHSKLYFENFPYTANSKTYCVDVQVAGMSRFKTFFSHKHQKIIMTPIINNHQILQQNNHHLIFKKLF
jgi:hypothetical protein